ncbi:thioredoxin fold domain-containing protein [Candidatus Micrarchaeota archaeon]|nr:thioredoxin fold domain-containing protein [Candidatus Micrarchaeota archaeon]
MVITEIQTPKRLREMIASGKPLVVKFTAGWCPDCRELRPHFEGHANTLERAGATVARITLSNERKEVEGGVKKTVFLTPAHSKLRDEFAKHGFPTVVFFNEGRVFATSLEDSEASYRKLVDYFRSRLKKK